MQHSHFPVHLQTHERKPTSWPMCEYRSSRASSHAYIACQMKVRSTNVGSGEAWKIFCQYTLCPSLTQPTSTGIILDPPANRIRSCKYSAEVVGESVSGWKEMIVLPSTFRTRWTESKSSTSWLPACELDNMRPEPHHEETISTHWKEEEEEFSCRPIAFLDEFQNSTTAQISVDEANYRMCLWNHEMVPVIYVAFGWMVALALTWGMWE